MKLVFLHGNGGCTADMNWYPAVEKAFREKRFEVVRQTLPDNQVAHEEIWIPYIRNTLKADRGTVLIGHSTGAIAAMRFAEKYPIMGSVLVSPYYTDLGMENERAGGWFDRPWDWKAIMNHQSWIIQFSSMDDPWIPIDEARYISDQLRTEYYEFTNHGHFTEPEYTEFPELVKALAYKL